MYDLIIKNGLLLDGSGTPGIMKDVAIKEGRVVKLGDLEGEIATKIIDANRKLVVPGFIDLHTHADYTFPLYPKAENYIMQGITTVVAGNCGYSPAPLHNYWLYLDFESDAIEKIKPYFYDVDIIHDPNKAKGIMKQEYGLDINWSSFAEFLNEIENLGLSVNYIPLVGHGQIRAQVMGLDFKRKSTVQEIERMKSLLLEAMEAGAYGMSTGLDYPPGAYADTEEILELCAIMRPYDAIYATHWRRTGLRFGTPKKQKIIDGIVEALEIGKATGLRVQLSHLFPGFEVYPADNDYMQKAAVEATFQIIDKYEKQGVRVAFDVIQEKMIYDGASQINKLAYYCFRPWIWQAGSLEQFIRNLQADDYSQELIGRISRGELYYFNPISNPQWDETMHIIDSENKHFIGKSISQIAKEKGLSGVETVIALLKEDPYIKALNFNRNVEAINMLLCHPRAVPCTDSFAVDLISPWTERSGRLPSTQTYNMTAEYLNEKALGSLEHKIRKLTGLPAEILGIADRGLIKEGYWADVLIVDINNLHSNKNYIDTRVYPSGIDYVVVNGEVVVMAGQHLGLRPGKIIRNKRT